MKNSKTTMAGIGAIITAIGGAFAAWPNVDWTTTVAAIIAGLGLVFAADGKANG
jgi:hypothetical protein